MARDVHHIASAYSATGVGSVIGNKGGLVVRLSVGQTSIAFCSCHLAAHEGATHLSSRNHMCQEILRETSGRKIGGTRGRGRPLDVAHAVDHTIWLGDLNYRLDMKLIDRPDLCGSSAKHARVAAVSQMCAEGQYAELQRADELRHARANGESFVNFVEGSMAFPPTFKVQRKAGTQYVHSHGTPWGSTPNAL